MKIRSIPIKTPLIEMMEDRFPDFRYAGSVRETYGFVRERPGCQYDYLPIGRLSDSGHGNFVIDWSLTGSGCCPDWYDLEHSRWRLSCRHLRGEADPEEPISLLTSRGPEHWVLYQRETQTFLPQALWTLADKIRRYVLPALDRLAAQPPSAEWQRWQRLAECILPRLALLSPEEQAQLEGWLRAAVRRKTKEPPPPCLQACLEEICRLPGFAEDYNRSPALRHEVFRWFTHALRLRI